MVVRLVLCGVILVDNFLLVAKNLPYGGVSTGFCLVLGGFV